MSSLLLMCRYIIFGVVFDIVLIERLFLIKFEVVQTCACARMMAVDYIIYFYRAIIVECIIHCSSRDWCSSFYASYWFVFDFTFKVILQWVELWNWSIRISVWYADHDGGQNGAPMELSTRSLRLWPPRVLDWIKVSKLHVWSCVHCDECFSEVIIM